MYVTIKGKKGHGFEREQGGYIGEFGGEKEKREMI